MSVTNANVQGKQNFWHLKRMVVMAFFIALSVVGAMLKIPSPTGTVALDSAPGFLGAALLGWREGALIAALGHLISSYTAGLPLSLPIHLLIALEMAIAAALYAVLIRKTNMFVTVGAVTIINGVGMPLSMAPIFGMGFFYSMLLPLVVASFVNTLAAALCHKALKNSSLEL